MLLCRRGGLSCGLARAGLGSATTNTSGEVGGVFGIALLGTILFTRLEAVLGPSILRSAISCRVWMVAATSNGLSSMAAITRSRAAWSAARVTSSCQARTITL